MALPSSDPKIVPNLTSAGSVGYTIDGRAYQFYVQGTDISVYCTMASKQVSSGVLDYADSLYGLAFGTIYARTSINIQATLWAGDTTIVIWQPLTYIQQTVAVIIYSVARWHCGISTSDIDDTSFAVVDTFCLGNGFRFSPSFIEESALNIIRDMCEQSGQTYIYVSGELKLACGYLERTPSTPATWIINKENAQSILSYGEIRDRQKPGTVNLGYDWRHFTNGNPKFGWYKNDVGSSADKDMIVREEYRARFVDGTVADWPGYYVDWDDYVKLEIEVGAIGYLIDIDDTVKVEWSEFGLSNTYGYPDIFRVHKIVYSPMTMNATLTLIKKKSWNSTGGGDT